MFIALRSRLLPEHQRRSREELSDELELGSGDSTAKRSAFWTMLTLSAVIASAGVLGDSTATVIGAMIIAPLSTPIMGIALEAVKRQRNGSVTYVTLGVLLVVGIGAVFSLVLPSTYDLLGNSQIASRVSPNLIDLVAALATGLAGAVALARRDVSAVLPGVAIAISLVPPLAVVGTTLAAGADDESAGALLLFLTNVGAILLSGLLVMELYRVRRTASHGTDRSHSWVSIGVAVAFLVVVCVPLAFNSAQIAKDNLDVSHVDSVADRWAADSGWRVDQTQAGSGAVVVRASGPPPAPSASALRRALDDAGLEQLDVRLVLTPEQTVELHGD